MAKMSDDELLKYLEAEQQSAFQYSSGPLASARNQAMRDYLRAPYGTEQDGRSNVISSDVFDTIEGMLPDLMEVFVSSDKAVVFDPVEKGDEEGADQATHGCNHVFYKQNNGFIQLYAAVKDALMLRTGAFKWFWEVKRTPNFVTFLGDEMQIALHLVTNPDAQVIEKEECEYEPTPEEEEARLQAAMLGVPFPEPPQRYKVRIKTIKQRGQVRLVALPPNELEVSARHNSILLDDCPYVAHKTRKTLSDIRELGFKEVTLDDVKAAKDELRTPDAEYYDQERGSDSREDDNELNDAMVMGWLREEYVLVDRDGDGVAERLKVTRLGKKILEAEEFSHVPIAAWSPYLVSHKFDGISVADLVTDIQRITTDILRNQIDNLALANNQETVVLTDTNGNPKANIDDLLNRRVGGIMRESVAGAIRPYNERWVGIDAMPMQEMVAQIKERRTGYSPVVAGLDADALSKTATEISKQANERQKRMKLMARILAEALMKPTFRGIFKTLTDYCMEPLSFRLNGKFVKYDPQEWRDGYDMTINVGIGTGDTMQQTQFLMGISQMQGAVAASPYGQMLLDPEKVFNVQSRLAELAGFKNPEEFWNRPPKDEQGQPVQPKSGPPPELMIEQVRGQIKLSLQEAQNNVSLQQKRAELELQAQNDARDAQREREKAAMEAQIRAMEARLEQQTQERDLMFQYFKAELDAATKITAANIQAKVKMETAATQAAEREASEDIRPGNTQ